MRSLTLSSLMAIALSLGGVGTLLPTAALATELSVIQERGYLIVGVKDNLRPLGFRDAEGDLVGLEIDVAHRLAEELLGDRTAVVFYPVQNRDRLTVLLEGEVDLVIAGLTRTNSRSRIVSFSAPYYLDGTAFVTQDAAIQTLVDAGRSPIAVLNESSTIANLRSYLPQPTLIGVDSYQEGLELLETGQAATFAGDTSVLAGWVQTYPAYRLLTTSWSADSLSVATRRGNQYDDLRRQINEAIASWYTDGWIQDRMNYWGLPF